MGLGWFDWLWEHVKNGEGLQRHVWTISNSIKGHRKLVRADDGHPVLIYEDGSVDCGPSLPGLPEVEL